MRVAIPIHDGRISPLFDVARHLLVIDVLNGKAVERHVLAMQEPESLSRGRSVAAFGIDVLICGAISMLVEAMLESAGVTVIARKCGAAEAVLRAFMAHEVRYVLDTLGGHGRCRHKKSTRAWPSNQLQRMER